MKILVGLSGGVDSAYAALRLIRMGAVVEGAVLKMHKYTDIDEASEVARGLGIPIHVIDCSVAFESTVVKNFISEYKNARTPNPCVICNSEIKFIYLLKYALENGFDLIATGHYAAIYEIEDASVKRLSTEDVLSKNPVESKLGKRYALGFGTDEKKDQTYMLWRLPQSVLSRLVLPTGDECKAEVKKKAGEAGIPAAERQESQEICFIPDGNYASYIENRTEPSPEGCFVDEAGNILGKHRGIIRYTVGQRRGLGISASGRIFVKAIDPVSNNITLSLRDSQYTRVTVSGISYQGIAPRKYGEELTAWVKLRYAAPPVEASVRFLSADCAQITLKTPVRAVTAGQSAVFYRGGILAFGGFIDRAE